MTIAKDTAAKDTAAKGLRGGVLPLAEMEARAIDDTFGEVVLNGEVLDRKHLWQLMTENTLY